MREESETGEKGKERGEREREGERLSVTVVGRVAGYTRRRNRNFVGIYTKAACLYGKQSAPNTYGNCFAS